MVKTADIYTSLADHQRTEESPLRQLFSELHVWAERFNTEFKLGITQLSLQVDKLASATCGHYRARNGFALRSEIALNIRHVLSSEFGDVLGTLAHEQLHAWEEQQGKSKHPSRNHHSREFRAKALELGLIVDDRGRQTYAAEGPFQALLEKHGVKAPAAGTIAPSRLIGSPKNKKWSCGCTNVRCAVQLEARCDKCKLPFRLAEKKKVERVEAGEADQILTG